MKRTEGTLTICSKNLEAAKIFLKEFGEIINISYCGEPDITIKGCWTTYKVGFYKSGLASENIRKFQTTLKSKRNESHRQRTEEIIGDIFDAMLEYTQYSRYDNILEKHKTTLTPPHGSMVFHIQDDVNDVLCSARNRIDSGFEPPCVLDKSLESLRRIDLSILPKKTSKKLKDFSDSDWLLLSKILGFSKVESEDYFANTTAFWDNFGDDISLFCSAFNVDKQEGDEIIRLANTIKILKGDNVEKLYPLCSRYKQLYPYEVVVHVMDATLKQGAEPDVVNDIEHTFADSEYATKIRQFSLLLKRSSR